LNGIYYTITGGFCVLGHISAPQIGIVTSNRA